MATRNRRAERERDLRHGDPVPKDEEAKRPALLRGPANQLTSREIRNNTIHGRHLAPGSVGVEHLTEGAKDSLGKEIRTGTTNTVSVSAGGEADDVVTLPLGVFDDPPRILLTNLGTGNCIPRILTVTTSSFTVRWRNVTDADTTSANARWLAIEQD